MATYVLIHGAGDSAFYWHLVAPELRERGHDVVAMDLPCDDDSAGLSGYTDTVIDAIGGRREPVVVAQSFGAFTAPLVCERVPVELIVLVAGTIPAPGERGDDWSANTGFDEASREQAVDFDDEIAVFYHDVAPELAAEALRHGRRQSTPRVSSRGRSTRGRTSRRGTCSVATTAASRPNGCAASFVSGSGSRRTRSTAATAPP